MSAKAPNTLRAAAQGVEELDYVVGACCRTEPGPLASRSGGEGQLDWDVVYHFAVRHRVEGLVWKRLAQDGSAGAPQPVLAAFEGARRSLAFAYLGQLGESLRLSSILLKAGIPAIVLKGCAGPSSSTRPSPNSGTHSTSIFSSRRPISPRPTGCCSWKAIKERHRTSVREPPPTTWSAIS
jgi:hypothetical protein